MTHAPTPILRATTAICAVLALGFTPVWAQDVAPAIDAPAASAPAPAQPTITLPTDAPAPTAPAAAPPAMVSQPMIQQTPVVAPPTTAAEATAPARRTVERATSAARPAARSAPAQPAAAPAAPAAARPVTAEAPMSPAASLPLTQSATTPPPADTSLQNGPQEGAQTLDDASTTAAVGAGAALLLALGLGAGYAVTRRRRRVEAREDAVLTTPATAYAEPAPRPVATRPINEPTGDRAPETPLPVAAVPAMPLDTKRAIGEEELVPATHPATSQPAASLDGPVPQTRAERDVLLDRMVSAPPDASNPFTSRKARLRRARIILQSREIDEKNAATKPFDWRTYKSPTSNPAPATPPRVTA